MAFDNKEIEVKLEIDAEEHQRLKGLLDEEAEFVSEGTQRDVYMSPRDDNFFDEEFPYKWLSLRSRDGRYILNYKHYYPEGAERHTYCDEYETDVTEPDRMMDILGALGVKKVVEVVKRRLKYVYKGDFEVVLDEVDELGHFIEIEALKDLGGIEETRRRVMGVIQDLGVTEYRQDLRGYPFLMLEKLKKSPDGK